MSTSTSTNPAEAPVAGLWRVDFASRISVRAILAGAFVELTALGLLMALGGGFGLWHFRVLDAEAMRDLDAGLYVWTIVAWVLAAFLGGLIAAVVSRSSMQRDGLVHGLVAWATACLVAGVLACTWFMSALAVNLAKVDVIDAMGKGMLAAFFVGDGLALCAALFGGLLGAKSESKRGKAELLTVGRATPTFVIQAPEPQHS